MYFEIISISTGYAPKILFIDAGTIFFRNLSENWFA